MFSSVMHKLTPHRHSAAPIGAAPTAGAAPARVSSSAAAAGTEEVTDPEIAKAAFVESAAGKHYILSITATQAHKLIAADRGLFRSTSDPFAKVEVVLADGSVLPAQQSQHIMKTLQPVWNHRFDFNCGAVAPRTIRLSVWDYDSLKKNDPLGDIEYAVTVDDLAARRPFQWLKLKHAKSGAVQVQVSLTEADPDSHDTQRKAAYADRVGLMTLRIDALYGLRPGPQAIKALGAAAFLHGEYELRAVLTFGLRHFNSRTVAGPALGVLNSGKAEAADAADKSGAAGEVSFHQDCRIWLKDGQQKYIAQVTLYAVPTGSGKKRHMVPVGRGYAQTELLGDGAAHVFHVHLREDDEDFTDKEESGMLAAAGSSPRPSTRDLLQAPPAVAGDLAAGVAAAAGAGGAGGATPATSAPNFDADDGSGFRSIEPVPHPDSPINEAMSPMPADAGAGGSAAVAAATPAPPLEEHTTGLEEAGAKGPVTGHLVLRGVTESKGNVEQWFFSRLMAEFDSDGNGNLDSTEFLAMLHLLGSTMTTDEVAALVGRLDASGDGNLDAAELLGWFRSADFNSTPLSYSLLAFLADGRRGLDELVNDVTRAVSAAGQSTKAGAAILAIAEGDEVVLADRGLKIYDRQTGLIMTEHIPGFVKTAINLMYHSTLGSLLTNTSAVRKLLHALSAREGAKMDLPSSQHKIADFVALHNINMAECRKERPEDYPNFNAFFYRELKPSARPIAAPYDDTVVTSPADSRMVVFPTLDEATRIWVKGKSFTVETLLGPACADVAPLFVGGSLCLARLAPQDYHRWHLPVTGRLGRRAPIDGALYTVNPIAIRRTKPDVYSENKREVLLVHTRAFGLVAMVAVGATVVGSINIALPDGAFAPKGTCHGYFAFGGSTVLVLFQAGAVTFDADLIKYSATPLETYVRVGQRIGVASAAASAAPFPGAMPATDPDYVAFNASAPRP